MSRSTIIITAAFFIILIPFLGFPREWEPVLFSVLGGVIIIVELYAVLARAQEAFFREYEIETDVYAEKRHPQTMKIPHEPESAKSEPSKEQDEKEPSDWRKRKIDQ
ncbi:MAG: hypothetical protein ACLFNN_00950 [Candidatus Paceibacterota bacterium]